MHHKKLLLLIIIAALAVALCILFFVIIPGNRESAGNEEPVAAGSAGPADPAGSPVSGGASVPGAESGSGGRILEFADPDPGSILPDPTGRGQFVSNELLVIVKEGTGREEVEAFTKAHRAQIVGTNDYLREYQIRFSFSVKALVELEAVRADFMASGLFSDCFVNYVLDLQPDAKERHPNDSQWKSWEKAADLHWGLDAIRVPEVWYGFDITARPAVKVGVMDNQFYTDHEDLNYKEVFHNRFNPGGSSHGTHVSGIIAADFNNGKGIAGIIPNVELYGASLPGLDSYEPIYVHSWHAALTYLIMIKECKVINISYGYSGGDAEDFRNVILESSRSIEKALLMFLDEGLEFLIVKSAGNDRGHFDNIFRNASFDLLSSITNPRLRDRIIVVGAVQPDGNSYQVCSFSSYGPRVDLVAPGWEIYSTVYSPNTTFELFHNYSGYASRDWTGTSMAAPHVSGTAAAMWCVNPNLTGAEVREILIRTAAGSYTYPAPDTEGVYIYHYPMVDAYEAVDMAARWNDVKKAPAYYYNPKSPAIRSRDMVYASSMEEAYTAIEQRYRDSISHYREMQEADDALSAGFYGDFTGNAPLYPARMDVTGDGTPELLFLATRDDVDEWNTGSADLFIYTWKAGHAEQILWIESFYQIAGNAPWYEIYQDGTGNGTLYFRYGCDSPGTQEKYELNESGQYALSMSVSGYCDYEALSESDAYTYYLFNTAVWKDEYDAARYMMEVSDKDKRLLFSSFEPVIPEA